MNKKDIKVGQKYKVKGTTDCVKIFSIVECLQATNPSGKRALFKVHVNDMLDSTKDWGVASRTSSGNRSKVYREVWIDPALLDYAPESRKFSKPTETKLKVGQKFRVAKENNSVRVGAIVTMNSPTGTFRVKGEDRISSCPLPDATYVLDLKWLTPVENPTLEEEDVWMPAAGFDHPHKEIKEAYDKGAKIEWRPSPHDSWMDAYSPWWLPEYEYRIKPEEPKFKSGDLCMFIGTSWSIRKNAIVKFVQSCGTNFAVVELTESKPVARGCRFNVHIEDLKPFTPVGAKVGDKLDVFAGIPNAGKSAFPFANLVMPDIAEAHPLLEMKVNKIRIRNAQTNPLQHEETPMKFETKYFLNGTDITNFSDMQLFAVIKEAEDAIAKLEDIKTQPKSLKQNIADRKAELAKLVEFLDKR